MEKLMFAVSGIRGVVGEHLTPEFIQKVGVAFGRMIGNGPIVIGGDTRTSHDMIKHGLVSSLTAVGIDCIDIGRVPTPTVQHAIRHFNAKGGLIITASHNPIVWNGIKLMNASGGFLEESEFESFVSYFNQTNDDFADWSGLGKVTVFDDAIDVHIDNIFSNIDVSDIKSAKLKVLVDPNQGTGCLANPRLFERIGIKVDMINVEPSGIFSHDPEPMRQNLDELITKMKESDYDIGFAQDADADRLVIIDENGEFIGEDTSLAFCVDYILSQISKPEKQIVVNLSTSLIIEWLANKYQAKIDYTKIGESHVAHGMKLLNADVGGEGNGGVIFPKVGHGRDSLVGMVIALKMLVSQNKTVSEIVSEYPKYCMIRDKFTVKTKEEVTEYLKKY